MDMWYQKPGALAECLLCARCWVTLVADRNSHRPHVTVEQAEHRDVKYFFQGCSARDWKHHGSDTGLGPRLPRRHLQAKASPQMKMNAERGGHSFPNSDPFCYVRLPGFLLPPPPTIGPHSLKPTTAGSE